MNRKLAARVAAIAALASIAFTQTLVRSVPGPGAGAQYGKACIVIGDQNADGYKDLLVGAPGVNQDRGAIYCLSGAYLASGAGPQTLWSCLPAASQGDRFGEALIDVGDLTGDNVHDFLVGQPGFDIGGGNDVGAVRLISGSSHVALSMIAGNTPGLALGSALAACGDVTGDGKCEVVVGAPGPLVAASRVYRIDGEDLAATAPIDLLSTSSLGSTTGAEHFGASLAGGFDIDADGRPELVVGSPGHDEAAGADTGGIRLYTVTPTGFFFWHAYFSTVPGEQLGASVDGGYDFDANGSLDVIAGAPNSPSSTGSPTPAGRVVVFSGANLMANTSPYEIRTFTTGGNASYHFGAAVRAAGDLNGDGIGDILGGQPDYLTLGGVRIFSGATGSQIAFVAGSSFDNLGDSIAGAVDDLDGDGFKEFVIAGSLSNAGGSDSGVVKCFRLFPLSPSTYCTAKLNSLGCTPAIASSGSPKAVPTAPFLITASNFINQKTGLLFYSHNGATTAFQGGFKCAGDPVRRTGALNSGGSTSGSDCTGMYSLDFNARIANGVDPSLVAGAEIYAQYWSRDPISASHTSLSNALRFLINP